MTRRSNSERSGGIRVVGEGLDSRLIVGPVAGAAGGAALMYVLDPDRGRRRRARMRDKAVHASHETVDAAGMVARDARNRGRGMTAEARKRIRRGHPDDDALVQQVRSEIAAVSRHPGALTVDAEDGVVNVDGPILAAEADHVRDAVRSVPGVVRLEDDLQVHDQAGTIPSLQGQGRVRGRPRPEFLQRHWAPAPALQRAPQAVDWPPGVWSTGDQPA